MSDTLNGDICKTGYEVMHQLYQFTDSPVEEMLNLQTSCIFLKLY